MKRDLVLRHLLLVALLAAALFAAILLGLAPPGAANEAQPFYSLPWNDNPFHPGNLRTNNGKMLDWRSLPSGEQCGGCHKQEYREWAASMHAITGNDVLYESSIRQNELASHNAKGLGTEKIRWCDSCHEPLGILTGASTPLPQTGPNEAVEEGAACVLCHTASAARPVAGNGGLTIALPELRRYLDPSLIMAAPAEHVRAMRSTRHDPLLATSAFCGACHNEIRPSEIAGTPPMHFQETFDEWQRSRYAKQGVQCQHCHMARDPAGYLAALKRGEQPAKTISHRFIGNNYLLNDTSLPNDLVFTLRGGRPPGTGRLFSSSEFRSDLDEQRRQVLAFMQQAADLRLHGQLSGRQAAISVEVRNSGAGHDLPTGARDQRYMWLELSLRDRHGVLHQQGTFDLARQAEDPQAVKWLKIMRNQQGEHDRRHILFDVQSYRYTRKPIAANSSDTVNYRLDLARLPQGTVSIEAKLWYRLALPDILKNAKQQLDLDLSHPVPPILLARTTLQLQGSAAQ